MLLEDSIKPRGGAVRTNFDEAYYRRYYGGAATKARDRRTQRRLASLVFAYLDHLEIPVRRVVDLGCGLGAWRRELAARYPTASYTGVEASEYPRRKYGWDDGTAATYRGRGRYDLVICQGVLQYVDDGEFRASIANIARLCRGAAFLEIPTVRDWNENCDRSTSDGQIYMRSGEWYRREIGRHFRSAGGGVWLPKDSDAVLYELEGAG
ncbi:MAG: methyltransferase domain-containing protein [Dehalococcoidia bacterium]